LSGWLRRNAQPIQAAASLASAVVAVLALGGIVWQVGQSARQAREQSARDIYREFLNLSIQNPKFANADYCTLKREGSETAYLEYVDYMLYTAEQVLTADPQWRGVVEEQLERHDAAVCRIDSLDDFTPAVAELIEDFKAGGCTGLPQCN
jgi:hypothetical protein